MRELAGRSLPPIGLYVFLINEDSVSGSRFPEATQRESDTEHFSDLSRWQEPGA